MSYKIKKNEITLTRGDTLNVKVDVLKDGVEYIPEPGDTLRFAMKHPEIRADKMDYVDDEPLILKEIPIDTQILHLDPADTKPFPFGDYVYDIELVFADGTVDTIITSTTFTLTEEVE